MNTLLCWIGFADIRSAENRSLADLGPIGQLLTDRPFDNALLLLDKSTAKGRKPVEAFLTELTGGAITFEFRPTDLANPTDFRSIYRIASVALSELLEREPRPSVTVHMSPGTPAMQAVWILLSAKSTPMIQLVQSSTERGIEPADIPFDIHAEFVPELVRSQRTRLTIATVEPHLRAPGFEDIRFKSSAMARVVARARKIAAHDVSVLILGESGTGKEMIAKAICKASARPDEPVVVNCGAFPPSLLESLLFGYVKGAFTGAEKDKKGTFEAAHGGTVFLDEIGEMPLESQSRLLRVLQERKVLRLGATVETPVDVRIISATNLDLKAAVRDGSFREDLYYRLAITTLLLPPLRDRQGDLQTLTDVLFEAVLRTLGTQHKTLTPAARRALSAHSWPGNVRELQATLTRAVIWSHGLKITDEDIAEAIESAPLSQDRDLLSRPLGNGFSLDALLEDVKLAYVRRALDEGKDNKSRAAELLGYKQQTLWAYLNKKGLV